MQHGGRSRGARPVGRLAVKCHEVCAGAGSVTRCLGYTVRRAVEDWLREGLDGRSERTRGLYEGLLEPVLEIIGGRPLRGLSAGDVRSALGQLTSRYSTRSLQITRTSLDRAIRHAQANDLVGRNVAARPDCWSCTRCEDH